MKLKKIMAAMVACLVMWASLGVANATTKADTVTPLYLYARTVSANLQISSSGYATCFGRIVTKGTENDISITVTLYRQSGKDWIRVDGWGNLKTGTNILNLQKKSLGRKRDIYGGGYRMGNTEGRGAEKCKRYIGHNYVSVNTAIPNGITGRLLVGL